MNGLDAPVELYSGEPEMIEEARPLTITLFVALIAAVTGALGHPLIAAWLCAMLLYWLFLKGAASASDVHAPDEPGSDWPL